MLLKICSIFAILAVSTQRIQAQSSLYNLLVWSDEFDGNGSLDASRWFHQTQLPLGNSWYNGEVQHYTNRIENSFQQNGFLNIVAKKESFTDQGVTKSYTAARLNSKKAFKYGRFEMRAKLPSGAGTWPAFWLLGKNINEPGAYWQTQGYGTTNWPYCGEIDILEHWGNNQNYVQSAVHSPSSYGGTVNLGGQSIPTASTGFHTYVLEWTPNYLQFSVDNVVHYTYLPSVKNASTWPFDAEQYILLNFAIQNNISPTYTQDQLVVDFVRVYQNAALATTDQDIKNNEWTIFPNPVFNEIHLKTISKTSKRNAEFSIYDASSKLVQKGKCSSSESITGVINVQNLLKGSYFLVVTTDEGPKSFPFIKN